MHPCSPERQDDPVKERRAGKATVRPVVGGIASEAVAALLAVAVSVAGLASGRKIELAAIAAIALGMALVFEGLAVGSRLVRGADVAPRVRDSEAAAIGIEAIAGLVGAALGVLVLARTAPRALLPATAIVFGASLVLGSHPLIETTVPGGGRPVQPRASGAHALAGVGAVILGIVGLTRPISVQLSLVAFLAVSGTLVLGTAALGGRLLTHRWTSHGS
jgi:hypothetical protein